MKIGVGFLILAMALTPLTDGFSKSLVQNHTTFFVVFVRYFSAGVIALLLAIVLKKPIEIPRNDRLGQVFRTALMMGAMVALIFALSLVPLAKAVGGFLIAPVVATIISVIMLKEKMCTTRLIGSLFSFIGAYIILKPEGGFEFGTFMALFGGFLLGCYLAATRRATVHGGAFSTLIVQCLLGAAMIAPLAFIGGFPVLNSGEVIYILALGAVSAICHFLTVLAYHKAEASVLAPFFYFNIVFAIPVGYFWFLEVPSLPTLIGLFCIVLGGILAMISVRVRVSGFTGLFALPVEFARKFNLKV